MLQLIRLIILLLSGDESKTDKAAQPLVVVVLQEYLEAVVAKLVAIVAGAVAVCSRIRNSRIIIVIIIIISNSIIGMIINKGVRNIMNNGNKMETNILIILDMQMTLFFWEIFSVILQQITEQPNRKVHT